jgi:hypothetical protein
VSERTAIAILDGETRQPVEAILIDGVTIAEMEAVDRVWQPYLRNAVRDALARGVSRDEFPEHKHWEWRRKARLMTSESHAFGIEYDGEMQALMLVLKSSVTCRLPEQSNKRLIYIDYLAAAPWNLPSLAREPRFRLCGSVFITAAIRLSRANGYEGRIGLHSLPQAEEFYRRKCGMTYMGIDADYEGLPYFEMTPSQVEAYERTKR